MFGTAIILLLGMTLAVALMALIFGMGWYLWKIDSSPIWLKLLWLLGAVLLSPFTEVAYFAFVYRRQVSRIRTSV